MWNARPTILEGEDETALRNEFARLVAKHPAADIFQVGEYVFQNLKDPGLRGQQAAMIWNKDLEVQELITKYRNGQDKSDLPTKEDAARLAYSIAEDLRTEQKDRLAALRLYGEFNGMIVKAIDKSITDTRRRQPPTVKFARYVS